MTDSIKTPSRALTDGTILANTYRISTVLGEGGFGITYGCEKLSDHSFVAVKEYFPANWASRVYQNNKGYIVPISGKSSKAFEQGKNAFLTEAEYMKRYHFLSAVVPIYEILHDNGTVYMVMEYIDGVTLEQYISENGAMEFDELFSLMTPVFHALMTLHGDGLLHRDISPDNLMIGTDNQIHLLDFGAARFENVFDHRTMTILLKAGYTPIEQYDNNSKQGAWTDIYALSATMYYCLTGITPPTSIERLSKDCLSPLAVRAKINSWQAKAIEKGMAVSGPERFHNMESFFTSLLHSPIEIEKQQIQDMRAASAEKTILPQNSPRIANRNRKIAGIAAICIIALFAALIPYTGTTKKHAACLLSTGILKIPSDNIIRSITDSTYELTKKPGNPKAVSGTTDGNTHKGNNLRDYDNNSEQETDSTSENQHPEQSDSTTTPKEKETEKYRVDSIEDEYDSIILD